MSLVALPSRSEPVLSAVRSTAVEGPGTTSYA